MSLVFGPDDEPVVQVEPSVPPVAPPVQESRLSFLSIGDLGRLGIGGNNVVFVARDWETFQLFIAYVENKDYASCEELRLNGEIYMNEPGTTVRILDTHFSGYKVRIESGQYAGLEGYVAREWAH